MSNSIAGEMPKTRDVRATIKPYYGVLSPTKEMIILDTGVAFGADVKKGKFSYGGNVAMGSLGNASIYAGYDLGKNWSLKTSINGKYAWLDPIKLGNDNKHGFAEIVDDMNIYCAHNYLAPGVTVTRMGADEFVSSASIKAEVNRKIGKFDARAGFQAETDKLKNELITYTGLKPDDPPSSNEVINMNYVPFTIGASSETIYKNNTSATMTLGLDYNINKNISVGFDTALGKSASVNFNWHPKTN